MKFVCSDCLGEEPCCMTIDGDDVDWPLFCPFSYKKEVRWKEDKTKTKDAVRDMTECELDGEVASNSEHSSDRGAILNKAMDIINGERQDTYGNPEDSFALIGEYWTSYLVSRGLCKENWAPITPREVAEMMMLFKIARMSGQKPSVDNYVDLAGYAGIAGDIILETINAYRQPE